MEPLLPVSVPEPELPDLPGLRKETDLPLPDLTLRQDLQAVFQPEQPVLSVPPERSEHFPPPEPVQPVTPGLRYKLP
jgi:hypothetical protein